MTDSPDYPAAHSMDTTWFAVDSDGRVAAFNSNEAGAVPQGAYLGEDVHEVIELIRAAVATQPLQNRLDGRIHFTGQNHFMQPRGLPLIVFVEREETAQQLVRDGARAVPASSGHAVVFDAPSDALPALHERGECLGCFPHLLPDSDQPDDPNFAARGLYFYIHDLTENWLAGPYGQHARPTRPISVDDLPAAARRKLAKFPGRFEDTPALQPTEIWPSESWEPAFLTSDLRTIAGMPGREADYASEYEELRADPPEQGIAILKPGESPAANSGAAWPKLW